MQKKKKERKQVFLKILKKFSDTFNKFEKFFCYLYLMRDDFQGKDLNRLDFWERVPNQRMRLTEATNT